MSDISQASPTTDNSIGGAIIGGAIGEATPAATNALGLAESKAEEYALDHLFGMVRGQAYYAVLTGNATVQSAVTSQNLKAVSWLEALFLRLAEPTLLGALKKVGLA